MRIWLTTLAVSGVALAVLAGCARAAEVPQGTVVEGVGEVQVIGAAPAALPVEKLKPALTNLLVELDAGKLPPVRVEVWKDHPLVKAALKGPSLRVTRPAGAKHRYLLIPFQDKGARIVVGQDTAFARCRMLEVPAGPVRAALAQACQDAAR